MAERYKVVQPGEGYYEEKKSRFASLLCSVQTEEEAFSLLSKIRSKNSDARHHVWAFVLPDGSCRWSDDGEPGGTSGAPTADVLKNAHLYGAVCITTRWFGGILLGPGGLVRAYSAAAKSALENAVLEEDIPTIRFSLTIGYNDLDRVHRLIRDTGALIATNYTPDGRIVLLIELPQPEQNSFTQSFSDCTGGRGIIKKENN